MATLRTGQVKKYRNDNPFVFSDDRWVVVDENDGLIRGAPNRSTARTEKHPDGGRIAKILKMTPKTVTVEISK